MLIVINAQDRAVVVASDRVLLVHPEDVGKAAIVLADGSVVHAHESAVAISAKLAKLKLLRMEIERTPPLG